MKPVYMSIQQEKTGRRIKSLLTESGYTVKDIQGALGFENPQAIYKWLSGKSLPNLDNFIILSRLLNTSIEDILVIDGDVVHLRGFASIFRAFAISGITMRIHTRGSVMIMPQY